VPEKGRKKKSPTKGVLGKEQDFRAKTIERSSKERGISCIAWEFTDGKIDEGGGEWENTRKRKGKTGTHPAKGAPKRH